MRVPGTQNCKDPNNPRAVRILSQADQRYNPSELLDYLDAAGVLDPVDRPKFTAGADPFVDDPALKINLDVMVSPDILKRCAAVVPNFKATWTRNRNDLRDPSQSGYDLALASAGVRARLSNQEIIDILVHHRRTYGGRPRTRIKYFQDSIRKAAEGLNERRGAAEPTIISSHVLTSDAAASEPTAIDPILQRAKMLDEVSEALGGRIFRIIKLPGSTPVYHVKSKAAGLRLPV
jgi:hypothetical protein